MTDDHLDDEQLTALLDGEGPPEARAHLEGCDRCGRRSAALADVAGLVAAPPPAPTAAERHTAVAAALAEADRPVAPARRPTRRRVPGWLAPAAAVVALLALVAAVVPRLGDGSDGDSRTGGRALSGGAEPAQDDGSGAGGGGTSEESAARAVPPGAADLGVVDDDAELADRVEEALAQQANADAAAPAAGRCQSSFRAAGEALGALRLRAVLEWRGQPAEVFSDGVRAVVVDAGGCTTLAEVTLG